MHTDVQESVSYMHTERLDYIAILSLLSVQMCMDRVQNEVCHARAAPSGGNSLYCVQSEVINSPAHFNLYTIDFIPYTMTLQFVHNRYF